MTATATTLDAALELAAQGYHVHSLRPGSKRPATDNGHLDASTDPAAIRDMWAPRANIGIALAASGLLVIGPDCARWLEEFERLGLPPTMAARSGSGHDHYHAYYRLPAGAPLYRYCVAHEFDIISNGYAIASPSVTTGPYEWLTPLRPVAELPEAPAWAVEMLLSKIAEDDAKPPPAERPKQPLNMSDRELLDFAMAAKNGEKVRRLYEGDLTAHDGRDRSHSGAELGLLSCLTFYTQDEAQLDRLYLSSGMARPEHWRGSYRLHTLAKALKRSAYYEPQTFNTGPTVGRNGSKPGPADAGTPVEPAPLADVVVTFKRWLYLPDVTALYVVIGAVIANELDADPVWLMLVGPPGCGKTEHLNALSGLPRVFHAATLTEAGLLSGTPKREKAGDASGGLLRLIGARGTLICKDFTSVLSMHRDARAGVLAALREVYDGAWTRHLGTDGGRTLSWSGKLGLIAGVTPAIDNHHAVTGAMGERFLYVRFESSEQQSHEQATRALSNVGSEAVMRRELSAAVQGLIAGVALPETLPVLPEPIRAGVVELATLVARCRSSVERDGYRREIEMIPEPESPGRLTRQLALLYHGMRLASVDAEPAWNALLRVGLDSMPAIRKQALAVLADAEGWLNTTEIAEQLGYPTITTRRTLEDLTAHGVAMRLSGGEGKADTWKLSGWARQRWERCHAVTFSEMSQGESTASSNSNNMYDDISEKVTR